MGPNQTIHIVLPERVQKQLERLEMKLDQLLTSSGSNIEGFISEEQAKDLIGKKTTWFYYKRKQGYLPYYRVGQKIFYKQSDLLKLIEDGKEE